MKKLYKKIQDTICGQTAIDFFASKGLPPVRYYDLYKGQYQSLDLFDVMPLPAVLFQWQLNHQEETAYISIHLVYELVRDTSSRSLSQENSLKFFEYIDALHSLLYNLESENTGKLETVSFEPVDMEAVGIVHLLNYKCSYDDNSGNIYDRFNYTDGDGEVSVNGTLKESIMPKIIELP